MSFSCETPRPTLFYSYGVLHGLPPEALLRPATVFFRDYRTNPPGCTERPLPSGVSGTVSQAMPKVTGRDSIVE